MVPEVIFPSDQGIFARTDSLRPELQYSGTVMGMGLDGIPEDSPTVARSVKIPGVLECCTAMVEDEKVFVCAQEFPPKRGKQC